MPSNASKWLTGCGIGCGAVLPLIIVLGTGGYLFVRSKMQGFTEAENAAAELEPRHGKISEFSPDPGGSIPRDRIGVFVEVHEKLAPARRNLEASFGGLSNGIRRAREGEDSIPQILGIIRQGFGTLCYANIIRVG